MPVVPVRVARSCLVPETSLFASIHSQFTAKFFTGSGQLRLLLRLSECMDRDVAREHVQR